ncbi:MAG: hypothetical protein AAB818_00355 [Patescibacteria group bacterium]
MNLYCFIKKHFLFLIMFLIISAYLGLKTLPENGWDDWAFGSAQTMMTMKYWQEDGIIANKFFFTPIGYSKAAKYIDEPEMRHHARGSTTGGLIGNRFYYTHYPSGYLLPHGMLAKIGLESRLWHRMMALSFSLAGLIFMYALLNLISTRMVAFLATLFYAMSTMFLGLADSLSNQPIDDFLRFLIMFLSAYAVFKLRGRNQRKEKICNISVWALYFILALSSYDSTFFVFVWLVGLDVIYSLGKSDKNGLQKAKDIFFSNWKRWLIIASIPISAFLVQMLQNVWYLGLKDALLDAYGSFRFRSNTGPGSNTLIRHIRAVFSPLVYMTNMRARFAIAAAGFLFAAFFFFKRAFFYKWPDLKILALFFLSAAAYPFILTSSGYFPYQGRQMAPFIALLVASSTILIYRIFRNKIAIKINKIKFLTIFIVFVILTGTFWFLQFQRTYSYAQKWPNNAVSQEIIDFAKILKTTAAGKDAIIFMMSSLSEYSYPQAEAVFEYYVGSPILSFKNTGDLVNDLEWLKNRSETDFLPIIVLENLEQAKYFASLSDKKAILITQNSEIVK